MAEWILTDKDIGMDGAYYDYPELIRCKDCKWHFDGTYYGGDHMCSELDRIVNENSFCAWAERKEEE